VDRKDERKGHSCMTLQLYSFISCEHLLIEDFLETLFSSIPPD